jgi:hypothetical protein
MTLVGMLISVAREAVGSSEEDESKPTRRRGGGRPNPFSPDTDLAGVA